MALIVISVTMIIFNDSNTVEPRYNKHLGTMKVTLLYQVPCYIRVKKQGNIKSWDQQIYLVITGFCCIRPLYNEVPLKLTINLHSAATIRIKSTVLHKFMGSSRTATHTGAQGIMRYKLLHDTRLLHQGQERQLKSLFPKRVKSTFGTSEKNRFLWQNLYTCLWENKI